VEGPDARRTLGELKASGYRVLPVREEMRKNLLARLSAGERILPGIIGYEDTVVPEVENAILNHIIAKTQLTGTYERNERQQLSDAA